MKLRLICAAAVVLISVNLDAGILIKSRIAEGVIPMVSIITGLHEGGHPILLGAGAIGLGLVGARYATDVYNYKSSFIEVGTKAFQIVLPLFSAMCFFGPCMGCCGDNITQAERKELEAESVKNGRLMAIFLACGAVEAAFQICA